MGSPAVSRLVSKLCVHGRVEAQPQPSPASASAQGSSSDGDGVRITLYCKVNLPHGTGGSDSRSYPLFPGEADRDVRLLSSSTYPLTPHGSLVLSPPPPPVILEAAKHLRVPTTFDRSASPAATGDARAALGVKVAVQDFAVCLLTEGRGGGESPDVRRRSGEGRGGAFSPTQQGVHAADGGADSAPVLVTMEVLLPYLSGPPLDRTSISIPLPRCLSNTLAFHLVLPPTDASSDNAPPDEFLFATSPKLLSSSAPSVAAATDADDGRSQDDLVLQGTFQSTTALEIRWAAADFPGGTSAGPNARVKGQADVKDARQDVEWEALAGAGDEGCVDLRFNANVEGDLHYAGVESIAYVDFSLDAPFAAAENEEEGALEWVDGPHVSGPGVGACHPLSLSSAAAAPSSSGHAGGSGPDDSGTSFDTSSATLQSPSPLAPARVKTLSTASSGAASSTRSDGRSFSRSSSGGGQSSSLPSLLRTPLPSLPPSASADLSTPAAAHASGEISFAPFEGPDSSSPSSRHASLGSAGTPGSRSRAALAAEYRRTARAWRMGVDVSRVLGAAAGADGERWNVVVQGTVRVPVRATKRGKEVALPEFVHGGAEGAKQRRVGVKAPEGWEVSPPAGSQAVRGARHPTWDVPLSTPAHVVLSRPSTSTSDSPVQPTVAKHARRRSSLLSAFPSPAQRPIHDPSSPFVVPGPSEEEGSEEALASSEVQAVLLPSAAHEGGWEQVTSLCVVLPQADSRDLQAAEDDGGGETWEFGIVAAFPPYAQPSPLLEGGSQPQVMILSATVDSQPVKWDLHLPPASPSRPEDAGDKDELLETVIPGALAYVQLHLPLRGAVEVRYVVVHPPAPSSSRWRREARARGQRELLLGLPSFEQGVAFSDTSVCAAEGWTVDLLSCSTNLIHLARAPSASHELHLISHSSPPLTTQHLRVVLHPTRSPPQRPAQPAWSWTRAMAFVLLLWLLASVGLEVRELRERVLQLAASQGGATAVRGQGEAEGGWTWESAQVVVESSVGTTPGTAPVVTAAVPDVSTGVSSSPDLPDVSLPSASSSHTVLRPTFTPIPPPAPPYSPPPPAPSQPSALARPSALYFPALHALMRRADGVLGGSAAGRSVRDVLRGVGRVVGWLLGAD